MIQTTQVFASTTQVLLQTTQVFACTTQVLIQTTQVLMQTTKVFTKTTQEMTHPTPWLANFNQIMRNFQRTERKSRDPSLRSGWRVVLGFRAGLDLPLQNKNVRHFDCKEKSICLEIVEINTSTSLSNRFLTQNGHNRISKRLNLYRKSFPNISSFDSVRIASKIKRIDSSIKIKSFQD